MKKLTKYVIGLLVIAAIIIGIGLMSFSTGQRVGKVVKFSKKGIIFKTYEGTLQLGDQGSNLWNFTVADDSVVTELEAALTKQTQVLVSYKEYYWNLTPQDTKYQVIQVVPIIEDKK